MEEWKPPAELDTVDIKVLELALSQTETRQKDIEATIANITARTQTLISLLTGIMIAALGFMVGNITGPAALLVTSLFTVGYSFVLCLYLIHYAYTGTYIPGGGTPSSVIQPPLFAGGIDDKARSLYIILLYGADKRLTTNHAENQRRWAVLTRATTAAALMPPILIVVYLLASAIGLCLGFSFPGKD